MSKYGNVRTEVDGHSFASIAEANRYIALRQMEADGEIRDLKLQPRYCLMEKYKDRSGKTVRAIYYVGDFSYYEVATMSNICEDTKGFQTQVFRLKWKLAQALYKTIDFRLS